jgi:cobalt-zinc-cadmium resistance protein CzcA
VPLFTLSGVEGHIFGPMAKTYAYALGGGLLATFTISPALCALFLPRHVEEVETVIVRFLNRAYRPLLNFTLFNRAFVLTAALALLLGAGYCVRQLGMSNISAAARPS